MHIDIPTFELRRRREHGIRQARRGVDAGKQIADLSSSGRRPIFHSVQYLRAISAIFVIFFHSSIQSSIISGIYAPKIGKFGVDIFFVISGFVMWESTIGRKVNPFTFLKKRWVRIVPLYWIFTLIATIVAFVRPEVLRSTVFNVPHFIASMVFIPWSNPAITNGSLIERVTPVINPGWTLNFEMLFYMLFTGALFISGSLRIWILALEILLIHFTAQNLRYAGAAPEFYAETVIFEFLFGVCVAVIATPQTGTWRVLAVLLVPIALVGLFCGDLAGRIENRWLWLGLPATMLVGAVVCIEKGDWMPRMMWLEKIGEASYSIYLSHVFVIAAARTVIAWASASGTFMYPIFFIPLGIVGSVGFGICVHRIIERRLTALFGRLLRVG